MRSVAAIVLCLWALAGSALAQLPVARLIWHTDSIRLGQPVHAALVTKAPPGWQCQCPDSSQAGLFHPFVVQHMRPATTTDNGWRVDTMDYTLVSWAVDSVQQLALPATCTGPYGQKQTIQAAPAGLPYARVVPPPYGKRAFKPQTELIDLPKPLRWALLGGVALALLALLAWLAWWLPPRYRRWRRLARLSASWQAIQQQLAAIGTDDTPKALQAMNALWMQWLRQPGLPVLASRTGTELPDALQYYTWLAAEDRDWLAGLLRTEEMVWYAGKGVSGQELAALRERLLTVLELHYHRLRTEASALKPGQAPADLTTLKAPARP